MWECLRCLEDVHTDAISLCGYFGHVKCGGQGHKAVELFQQLQPKECSPQCHSANVVSWNDILGGCVSSMGLVRRLLNCLHRCVKKIMCYYQTSILLPAATGTFENVEQQRKEKGVKKPH